LKVFLGYIDDVRERRSEKIIREIEATPTHAGCAFGEVGDPDDQEAAPGIILDDHDLEDEIGPTYGTNPDRKNGTQVITVYGANWPFYPEDE